MSVGDLFHALAGRLHMDGLTLFGLIAVTAMLVFYGLEQVAPVFILCFAFACVMGSAYGFLQGAWPFGIVESIWSLVALRKWWKMLHATARQTESRRLHTDALRANRL
jgi:hypothetical protein